MKRTVIAAVAVTAAALTVAGTGLAGSEIQRSTVIIDVAGSVQDGCDEPILMTGGHVVETIQELEDGNGRTHLLFHFRTHGLVGVGLESGATYRDSSVLTGASTSSFEDGFSTGGFTMHVRITSQDGAVADLTFRQNFRIVKRDGVNRVFMDSIVVECS